MKITPTWLEARREPKNRPAKRYDVTVDGREGLMVRVFPSGATSFRFRYTGPGGERRVMVLGEFGRNALSLRKAHELHEQAQRELVEGRDPIEERQKRQDAEKRARAERAGADTVGELVEQFVHRKLRAERRDEERNVWVRDPKAKTKPRKRPEAAEALLDFNLVKAKLDGAIVGDMKAADLGRRQLVRLLEAIVDRGAPVTANRVHALFMQMFTWAAATGRIPVSPMFGIERPGGDETPRDRTLTDEEIRVVWHKLDSAEMAEPTKLALKLLLVTGQRRGELTFARWDHFDLNAKTWTIPVALLKNSHAKRRKPKPHVVPLSPLALDLLGRLKELAGESEFVLPAYASKKARKSYTERVLTRAVRENEKHFGIPHWTPHDLRRTCRTGLSALKNDDGKPAVAPHIAEHILNHAQPGIVGVYDQFAYLDEMRAALEKWGEHLQAIVEAREAAGVPKEHRT